MQPPKISELVANQPILERAIAAVAPSYGLRRLQSRIQRHLFAYEAARADRMYAPKTFGQPAESTQVARNRITMMWEALDLVENFPLAKAVISRYGTFLTPTEYAPATGDRDYDAIIADYFHGWCKRADATGRHSFRKLIQLAAEMRPSYGDCGFVLRRIGDELKLQVVPGDRIGNPNEVSTSDLTDGRMYFSGVLTDRIGRPEAYRIFRVDTYGSYIDPEDIPASQFFHYFDPFRADQYRGITDFHAVARTARMLKNILDAEQAGVNFASQQAALVFSEKGQANPRNLFTNSNALPGANGELPKQEESNIGTIRYLYTGDKVEVMPSRPGAAFGGFVQTLMHEIALGLGGYPTGVLWGTQDFKGPSVRAEFAQADRVNARHQGILTDKILDPVRNAVILDAIAREEIPAPPRKSGETFEQSIVRATRGAFRFPPRLTIDTGRESQADMNENRQGAKSLQQIAADNGRDAFTTLTEIADEAEFIAKLAAERSIPETAIRLPVQQLPSTPASAAAIGVKAGEDAANAQAESIVRAEPEDNGESDELSAATPPSVRELINGPASRRAAKLEAAGRRMTRLNRLLTSMKDTKDGAKNIEAAFKNLN